MQDGEVFDRRRLRLRPLAQRSHDLGVETLQPLGEQGPVPDDLRALARRIVASRRAGRPVILMMGAHVLRAGVQRYLIDLLERGLVTLVAMNGACVIHDYEFALLGATTESVARYIATGEFGLWEETGRINDIVNAAHAGGGGDGLGEAVGAAILDGDFPHKEISLLAACRRLGVPATVHVGIGYDIIHEHPNFDGAAAGATSYRDFLRFAAEIERLEGGVLLCFGSAVMAPEVFLKALAMARNVAAREGRAIERFDVLVADLRELRGDLAAEPDRADPAYYFRPWKTLLARTVAGGGQSSYLCGRHEQTIPALWRALAPGRPDA
ncbi:MAG: GSU2086 family protein [Candidatus Methylomirabilia bacterium]